MARSHPINSTANTKEASNQTGSKDTPKALVALRRDSPKAMEQALDKITNITREVHPSKAHRSSRASLIKEPNSFEIKTKL